MNRINLTPSTTLQELQKFAEDAGNKSIRLKEEGGVKTLYTSEKSFSTGLKNLVSGQSDQRRNAARIEITQLLGDHLIAAEQTGAQLDRSVLHPMPRAGVVRGTDIANLAKALAGETNRAIDARGVSALGLQALQAKEPGTRQEAVDKMAAKLNARFEALIGASRDPNGVRMRLVATRGDEPNGIKDTMLKSMARGVETDPNPFATTYGNASQEVKNLLDAVYEQSVASLSGNKLLDPKGNELLLDGVKYVRERRGGEGGFGTVDIYKRDGGEERIAVKRPIIGETETPESKRAKCEEYGKEIKAHWRVAGGGHENVIGLKGAILGASGEPLIILEGAPHGDVYAAQKKLHASNATPQTKETVGLTLLRDMAKGLAQAHQNGVVHLDVKGPNFLVGEGGVVKLADMGTADGARAMRFGANGRAIGGATRNLTKNPIDNPIWTAPEVIRGGAEMSKRAGQVKQLVESRVNAERAKLEGLGMKGDELKTALADVRKNFQSRIDPSFGSSTFAVNEKADVWSFGMCAYQLLFNSDVPPQFDSRFMADIGEKVVAFQANPNNRIFTAPVGGQLTPAQDFINLLMHPDPAQRPAMQDVVRHPIFQQLGVGSPQTYALITGLQ